MSIGAQDRIFNRANGLRGPFWAGIIAPGLIWMIPFLMVSVFVPSSIGSMYLPLNQIVFMSAIFVLNSINYGVI